MAAVSLSCIKSVQTAGTTRVNINFVSSSSKTLEYLCVTGMSILCHGWKWTLIFIIFEMMSAWENQTIRFYPCSCYFQTRCSLPVALLVSQVFRHQLYPVLHLISSQKGTGNWELGTGTQIKTAKFMWTVM